MKNIKEIMNLITEDTFIISDTHFGHKNVLQFEPSRNTQMRIDSFENHDEWLVERWNSVVSPDDVVLHLGDFAFNSASNYLPRLNGTIILILGNHDQVYSHSSYNDIHVIDGCYLDYDIPLKFCVREKDKHFSGLIKEINGKRILFSHYPVFNDNEYDRKNENINDRTKEFENIFMLTDCDYNIHGHLHSIKGTFSKAINASLENINFQPKRIKELFC